MFKTEYRSTVLVVFFLITISFLFSFFSNKLIEPDNVLHIATASLYHDHGIFFKDFRWETFSVFDTYRSDMWYGFHLLLSLFVFGNNYLLYTKLATFFLTSVFLCALYLTFKKIEVKWPFLWVLFTLFSSSNQFLRFIDLRPHVVIMTLTLGLVYYLSWKPNKKLIFVISALYTFFEVSMFWLPPFIVGCFFLSEVLECITSKREFSFTKILSDNYKIWLVVGLGVTLGALLRPDPIASLYLVYYQIVYLYMLKLHHYVFPYVAELYPIDTGTAITMITLLSLYVTSTLVFLFNLKKNIDVRHRKLIFFTTATSFAFLLITIFSSIRAMDFFTVFGVISVSVIWSSYFDLIPENFTNSRFVKFLVGIFFLCITFASLFSSVYFKYYYGYKIDLYKNTADFLVKNTPKDSIVANLTFDYYPGLFLWNKQNRYLNHSDMVFQHAFNPKVNEEYLCAISALGETNSVLGEKINAGDLKRQCANVKKRDLVSIIRDDMRAEYIFVGNYQSSILVKYFLSENLKMVYSDGSGMIFKIN